MASGPGTYGSKRGRPPLGKTKAQVSAQKRIAKKKVEAKKTAVKKAVKRGLATTQRAVKTVGRAPAKLVSTAGKAVRKRVAKEMDKFEKSGMHQEALRRHKARLKTRKNK